MFVTKYTDLIGDNPVRNQIILGTLTSRLPKFLPAMIDEADHALVAEIPSCDGEWTHVNIAPKLLRIVAFISGRIFV